MAENYFDSEEILKDHLMRYLFAESYRHHMTAQQCGKNNVSCVKVDKIVFNFHTVQIVGFADDAFDIDFIKTELEGLCKNSDDLHTIDKYDEETEKDGDTTNTGKSDDVWYELHIFKFPDT
eukprot:8421855-Ditylum_brightwellii.AAC.1